MEINEAALIEREITVRDLRLTREVLETRRSIARWLALSLGVINPGESRQSAVAVLDALVYYCFIMAKEPTVQELSDYINSAWEPINEKTLRYHLLRLKKMGMVENSKGAFYFKRFGTVDNLDPHAWSLGMLESQYKSISEKVGEAIKELKNKA